ncbi:hypothetical protein EIP91_001249 [Steccherinum ochraceum]|uniref:Uncharacterized protein n=1 Tax=Steccherinum ochraceum TaxID=92696 RepID=A0A4R0RMV3_9APHY|nr:hypothetical protein EIP91_001249 [Steccherinum ochraceum]
MVKKPVVNNPRTPKTPLASQTPWSTPPPSKDSSATGSIHPAPDFAYDVTDHQGAARAEARTPPMSPKYPVSPPKSPTPKTPTARSPTPGPSVITAFTTQTAVARNAAVAKDVEAVDELLGTMKLTLSALGSTLDTLGEQTLHVAALGPAIDANHQIGQVRKHLEDQHKRQEQRMAEVKTMLKNEVMDVQLQEKLRQIAGVIVKEIVRKEIVSRVKKELEEQIPLDMREQSARYKRQIMEVKACLHNSEARRHNALIRSNALDEPLRPLLRPFAKPVPPPSSPHQPEMAPADPSTPKAAPVDADPAASDPTTIPILEIGEEPKKTEPLPPAPPTPVEIDLTPPTPSPLFPRDLTSLMRLSPSDAKVLVREYGLEPLQIQIPEVPLLGEGFGPFSEPQSSREEDLNRFMSHIGVGFHLVPGPNAPRPASPSSPYPSLVGK